VPEAEDGPRRVHRHHRGQHNHGKAGRAAMIFELLDNRAAGVRLLVKDHGVQASSLNQQGDFRLCGSIMTVDDEHVLGKLGVNCDRVWGGCQITEISEPVFQGADYLI
jgi:hypothetical protein